MSAGAYGALLQRVVVPAYSLLKGRKGLTSYLPEYERQQWLPPRELRAMQLMKLNALLAHAWTTVPFLRAHWEAAGVRQQPLSDLSELAAYPILTKEHLKRHHVDCISRPWVGRTLSKTTGGSTGTPMRIDYTPESYARRNAVMWRGYGWAGACLGARSVYLWGMEIGGSRSSDLRQWLYHRAFNRVMLNSFLMTRENLPDYAQRLAAARPEVVVGYVTPLLTLAKWALAHGQRLYRPRSVLTAAEALFPPQRALLEEAFGCSIYNTYGCRETMLIASQCDHGGLHWNADHLVVETVGSGGAQVGGVPGEVLLTDLHNYGMPLVRYANGDVAVASAASCSCGRSLPLLERVEGRTLDAIRTADGRVVPGEFFPYLLKDFAEIREYQVIQESLSELKVVLVLEERGAVRDELRQALEAGIRRAVGEQMAVTFEVVEQIPRTPSGKLRMTVSRVHEQASG